MIDAKPYLVDKKKEITSIQFIVRYKGTRLRFTPNISVSTEFWIDSSKWCKEIKKYPNGFYVNTQIRKVKGIIEEVLLEFQKDLIIPSQKTFKENVQKKIDRINIKNGGIASEAYEEEAPPVFLVDYAKKWSEKADRKKATKKSYNTIIKKIEDFEREAFHKRIAFDDVNMDLYTQLKLWMKEKEYSKNYIGSVIKDIIHFMNKASEDGLCTFTKPKGFVVEKEDADTIALSLDEIKAIHDVEFTREKLREHFPNLLVSRIQSKIKRLNIERDRFLIGCCTALRISDYSRIDELHIEDGIVSIWTKKKDHKIYVPIHYYLKEIIERYDGLRLPKISDQKHNERIKEVAMLAGINTLTKKTITRGAERVEVHEPKWKFVTSHTARRSGATNMYRSGIDILYISRILGHTTIEQTTKYLKITTRELAYKLKDNKYFSGG